MPTLLLYHRRPDPDLYNLSSKAQYSDLISRQESLVTNNKDTGYQILDHCSHGEADRYAERTNPCSHRGQVDAEDRNNGEETREIDDYLSYSDKSRFNLLGEVRLLEYSPEDP
jgi:hypothetical protein